MFENHYKQVGGQQEKRADRNNLLKYAKPPAGAWGCYMCSFPWSPNNRIRLVTGNVLVMSITDI